MRFKAFTLIELLVVIAIIAILAALLFPVFSHVREKARQSTCMSNKKNMASAFSMYVQDYGRIPPMAVFNMPPPDTTWGVHAVLMSYVKERQIFSCPTVRGGKYLAYAINAACPPCYARMASVFRNIKLTRFPPNGGLGNCPRQAGFRRRWFFLPSLAEFPSPADTISFWCTPLVPCGDGIPLESNTYACTISTGWMQVTGIDEPPTLQGPYCSASTLTGRRSNLHHEGTNYVFVDGHVKWYRPMQTFLPQNLWVRLK